MSASHAESDPPGVLPEPTLSTIERLFEEPTEVVARRLIGALLLVNGVGGRIVETEVCDFDRHSDGGRGRRARIPARIEGPGRISLFPVVGRHRAMRIMCDPARSGVLIRGLDPTAGIALMEMRRETRMRKRLCNGPGRLCQALAIDDGLHGESVLAPPFRVFLAPAPQAIVQTKRSGGSRPHDLPSRFGLKGSPHLGRPSSGWID